MANTYRGNREFATALEILDQVEEDIKKYNDKGIFEDADSPYEYPILMSHMLTIRALVYGMGLTGDINYKIKALEYCDEAFDFAVQAGDITRKASILNSKGLIICQLVERNLSLLQEASNILNDSLLLSSQIQDT